jgi:hypothetical protein
MPLLPILLVTEKEGKTDYFRTHFLFFTNNLSLNLENYVNTAAEVLKQKVWENNLVIFMCQNIKSTRSYINYLKKDPKHIVGTQKDNINLFLWFHKKYIYPDEPDASTSGLREQVPITSKLGVADYIESKLKSGIETLQEIMKPSVLNERKFSHDF